MMLEMASVSAREAIPTYDQRFHLLLSKLGEYTNMFPGVQQQMDEDAVDHVHSSWTIATNQGSVGRDERFERSYKQQYDELEGMIIEGNNILEEIDEDL